MSSGLSGGHPVHIRQATSLLWGGLSWPRALNAAFHSGSFQAFSRRQEHDAEARLRLLVDRFAVGGH